MIYISPSNLHLCNWKGIFIILKNTFKIEISVKVYILLEKYCNIYIIEY